MMASVCENTDYFARCSKCKSLFDIAHELTELGHGEVGDYFENYKNVFICRQCFGVLQDVSVSGGLLISLRETIDNYSALTFQNLLNKALNFKFLIEGYTAATELPSPTSNHFKLSQLRRDLNARNLLTAYGDSRSDTHTPIDITGDGDCLFNSVAVALWMNEEFCFELRLRTALEIIINRELYDSTHAAYAVNQQGYSFEVDVFQKFLTDCLTVGRDMSPAHLVALVNTLRVPLSLSHPRKAGWVEDVTPQIAELNSTISLLSPSVWQLEFFCTQWSVHMTTMTPISADSTYEDVDSIIPNHYCILLQSKSLTDDSEAELEEDFVHKLPSGKPFRAAESLHVLHRRGTEKADERGIRPYSPDLVGKYYLCKHGYGLGGGLKIGDDFESVGIKASIRCTKKRIYFPNNFGRFTQVKLAQRQGGASSAYTFPNGELVPFSEYSNLTYMYQNQRCYDSLTRTVYWLTDSNWICNGTVLVTYSCKNESVSSYKQFHGIS